MLAPLTPVQLRVLGALAEKAATVPDTYPMTLKGLQTACNQKNSRDPVTDYDTFTIQTTLDDLKALGLVRFVYASHGARTTKYRHVLDDVLQLDAGELALLSVLALRGPQTVNELRTRTERAYAFADNDEVTSALGRLAERDDPLVLHLPRQSGQKETRWVHLLGGDPEPGPADPAIDLEPAGPSAASAAVAPAPTPTVASAPSEVEARLAALERRVAELEAALAAGGAPHTTAATQEQHQR